MHTDDTPAWAYSWCYFFAGMGVVAILTGLSGLIVGKKLGTGLLVMYLLAAAIQAATSFTLFYMCRSSLRPVSH
jgi:hypothetical protein